MTDYVELYIDRGSDFSIVLNINDDDTNMAENTAGMIVTGQLRKSLLSVNASANLVCIPGQASEGEIIVSLDAANTANLKPGPYFFDINTRRDNTTSKLIEGVIYVTHTITR